MALHSIDGIFRDGRIELATIPPDLVDGTAVTVQFPAGATGGSPSEREAMRLEAFADMEAGLDLGGPPYPTRNEIYNRHGR